MAAESPGGFTRWYGASPLHAVAIAVNAAISGYAFSRIAGVPRAGEILIWLAGSIALFDFVLFPLLLVGDVALRKLAGSHSRSRPPWLNHLRLPVLLSALLLLVFYPLVARRSARTYLVNTGLPIDPYLWRWLGLVAVLAAASAALYAFGWWRWRRRSPAGDPS